MPEGNGAWGKRANCTWTACHLGERLLCSPFKSLCLPKVKLFFPELGNCYFPLLSGVLNKNKNPMCAISPSRAGNQVGFGSLTVLQPPAPPQFPPSFSILTWNYSLPWLLCDSHNCRLSAAGLKLTQTCSNSRHSQCHFFLSFSPNTEIRTLAKNTWTLALCCCRHTEVHSYSPSLLSHLPFSLPPTVLLFQDETSPWCLEDTISQQTFSSSGFLLFSLWLFHNVPEYHVYGIRVHCRYVDGGWPPMAHRL